MLHFFIKSTICFALLFSFYKFFLEREKMHHFNRFYLMSVLILSIVIPSCSFYINSPSINSINGMIHQITSSTPSNNVNAILIGVYSIGVFMFGLRFFRNLNAIYKRISENSIEIEPRFKLVLIKEKLLPHTFLNYVFVNRMDYEERVIHDELFMHEYVHVYQKHSLDVIISEIFQIIFWFNPFTHSLKHAIKLNHEFLADDKVIKTYRSLSKYQHILLDIASQPFIPGLTSNLNYSLTKMRFQMMIKKGSKRTQNLLKLLFIPVLLFSLFAFSDISSNNEHSDNEHANSSSWFSNNSEHSEEEGHH